MASDDSQAGINRKRILTQSAESLAAAPNVTSELSGFEGEVEALTHVADFWPDNATDTAQSVFQAAIHHMQEAVFLIDRNYRVLAINDSALAQIGFPSDMTSFTITPELYMEVMKDFVDKHIEFQDSVFFKCLSGNPIRNEKREFTLRDGSKRHFICNGVPIYGKDGVVELALVVMRDVTMIATYRTREEKLLAEAKRQRASLRQILNHMPAGVVLLDSEMRVLAANKRYAEYFDSPVQWSEGVHIKKILPFAEESGILAMLREALEVNRPVSVKSFRYDGFNRGVTYWSGSAIPAHLQYGGRNINGLALAVIDVTEEVNARERLAELAALAERRAAEIETHNARLNTMIEAVPIPLLVIDKHWNLTSYNSAALKLIKSLGVTQWLASSGNVKEIKGLDLLYEDGTPIDIADTPMAKSLKGRICRDIIIACRPASGPLRFLSVNSAPLKDARGRITGAVHTASDVTEQVENRKSAWEIYQRERMVANKLQRCFLPEDLPWIEGFHIAAKYHFAQDENLVGGDFYDVFPTADGKFGIVMGDVAGKGIKSAVYTAMTKYMLRAYALERCSPESVLSRLNEALTACTPYEVFVTLVYGVLDPCRQTFIYANAGHEQPMLYSANTGSSQLLSLTGRALGLVSKSTFETSELNMVSGDILLFYTDGITDAGWGVDRLGHDNVLRTLKSAASAPVDQVADAIRDAAAKYAGGNTADDAAVLVLKAVTEDLQ